MMGRILSLNLVLVAALGLGGCQTFSLGSGGRGLPEVGSPIGAGPAVAGSTAWSGSNAAVVAELTLVARDARSWEIMWNLVGMPAPGALPDGGMAVAVFLDGRPSAGYGIEILDVSTLDEVIRVAYQETAPAPDALHAQVLTAPYAVRMLPISDLPVEFIPAAPFVPAATAVLDVSPISTVPPEIPVEE